MHFTLVYMLELAFLNGGHFEILKIILVLFDIGCREICQKYSVGFVNAL